MIEESGPNHNLHMILLRNDCLGNLLHVSNYQLSIKHMVLCNLSNVRSEKYTHGSLQNLPGSNEPK